MGAASEIEIAEEVAAGAATLVTPLSPTVGAILSLVATAIKEVPALISEIEALIANAKAEASGGDPSTTPLAPKLTADTAALAAKLAGK